MKQVLVIDDGSNSYPKIFFILVPENVDKNSVSEYCLSWFGEDSELLAEVEVRDGAPKGLDLQSVDVSDCCPCDVEKWIERILTVQDKHRMPFPPTINKAARQLYSLTPDLLNYFKISKETTARIKNTLKVFEAWDEYGWLHNEQKDR